MVTTVVPEDNWQNYSYQVEGKPVFVSFHTKVAQLDQEAYPHCARVIIPMREPSQNGTPGEEEAETLWGLEDELVADLVKDRVTCLMLARMTHSGDRELVFQVADWESFRPPVGRWIFRHEEYEIDVSEHDGWSFFENHVWPSEDEWGMIYDRRVVDSLVESGSDPTKEHELEFFFRGDLDSLRRLGDRLRQRGYLDGSLDETEGTLLMLKHLPLDLPAIWEETCASRQACEGLDAEFDGWGALVVG